MIISVDNSPKNNNVTINMLILWLDEATPQGVNTETRAIFFYAYLSETKQK